MNDIVTQDEALPALGSGGQLVTVRIGGRLFGFPAREIKGIAEAKTLTPVPLAPGPVSGMMNLRGRPVAVLELQAILNLSETTDPTHRLAVTVEDRGERYALLVDEIDDFVGDQPEHHAIAENAVSAEHPANVNGAERMDWSAR